MVVLLYLLGYLLYRGVFAVVRFVGTVLRGRELGPADIPAWHPDHLP